MGGGQSGRSGHCSAAACVPLIAGPYLVCPALYEQNLKLHAMGDQPLKESDLASVPANLPEPQDDGACDHLRGMAMPSVPLQSTDGRTVDMNTHIGIIIAYFYPMTGRPGVNLPEGWDQIPGARGIQSFHSQHLSINRWPPGGLSGHRRMQILVKTLGAPCVPQIPFLLAMCIYNPTHCTVSNILEYSVSCST